MKTELCKYGNSPVDDHGIPRQHAVDVYHIEELRKLHLDPAATALRTVQSRRLANVNIKQLQCERQPVVVGQ